MESSESLSDCFEISGGERSIERSGHPAIELKKQAPIKTLVAMEKYLIIYSPDDDVFHQATSRFRSFLPPKF